MTPYLYSDYKAYLIDIIKENLGRGGKAQLSEAAGCQRSFLSQVLNGPTHLTMEHALGMSLFLKLTIEEREYFLNLVGIARSASLELTSYYKNKLIDLKTKAENLSSRLKTSRVSPNLAEYYSTWKFSAIHILCTIPKFQTVSTIANKLEITTQETEQLLLSLENMGLVNNLGGRWVCSKNEIHLPKNHFMTNINHQNWREKNLKESEKNPSRNIAYTATYSMSREDFEKLKELCLRFLEESRSLVVTSKEEELVSFTLDCVIF